MPCDRSRSKRKWFDWDFSPQRGAKESAWSAIYSEADTEFGVARVL